MTESQRRPSEYAAFAGMSLVWGSTFLAIRVMNDTVPPLWGASIRLALAGPLLYLTGRWLGHAFPRGEALRAFLLFGSLNLGLNFALLYWGEQWVPSGIAAVLYATVPLTSSVFAWTFGLERPRLLRLTGALLGLLGVVLIFAGEIRLGAPAVALGAVFLGATAASLSSIVIKRIPHPSPFMVNAVGVAGGLPVCLAGSFLLGEPHRIPPSFSSWLPIVYLVLAGNFGAYVLWAWLVSRWEVTTVSNVALVVPVIAVVIGAVTRGEAPAPETYVGGLVVLSGVALALRRGGRNKEV